ncbi:MAG: preprotein translocase subunit SecE [Thermoanaerobaculia bacterium]
MEFAPKQWWQTWTGFWHETKAEMRKVTWPNRNEVVGTTGVVLIATIFFGVFLWVCDLAFYHALSVLFGWFGASV